METGVFLKDFFASGVLGDYTSKTMVIASGHRDCGKSLVTDAIQACFGPYVFSFDANNLYPSPAATDVGKKLAFVSDFVGKKIVIANEIKIDPKSKIAADLDEKLVTPRLYRNMMVTLCLHSWKHRMQLI